MSHLCRLRNAKHGEDGQWAYREIVTLRLQLAAEKVRASKQLAAAQLKTAEACISYILAGSHDDDPYIMAEGITNGEWRKYLE